MPVRRVRQEDAESLSNLFYQLGYKSSCNDISERISQHGDNELCLALVAIIEGILVGVVCLSIITPFHEQGEWGLITALVVDETRRGTGIGRMLLREIEAEAKKRGCTQIELSSSERRVRAHAFYESNGYLERRKRFVKAL